MNAIILDCETTDKDPATAEIIEFAWREFHLDPTTRALEGSVLCGHTSPIKWGALAAHHIRPEELIGLDKFDVKTFEYDIEGATFWIGHNIDFDWQCMGSPLMPFRICTLAMARDLWPQVDSHTLTALTYFTQGASKEVTEKLRSAHSATADVRLCEELLRVIIAEKGIVDMSALYEYSEEARIPKVMIFGKFKGEPLSSVDRGYANWYRRQPSPDPYLITAFRRAGLI